MFTVNVKPEQGYTVYDFSVGKNGWSVDELTSFMSAVSNSTRSQERSIRSVLNVIERNDLSSPPDSDSVYEVKQLVLVAYGRFITIASEIGLVGDEGTLAAIFGRDSRRIKIGRNGGLKARATVGGDWSSDKPLATKVG